MSCYCLCKDTNSQASHNEGCGLKLTRHVVIAYAKIANIYKNSKCKLKKKIFSYNSLVMLYKMVFISAVIIL